MVVFIQRIFTDLEQEAGKLLLRSEPIIFNDHTLQLSEEGPDLASNRPTAPPPKTGGLFVPRAAASRPRAGLGNPRKRVVGSTSTGAESKGQDEFRKMLEGNR